MACTADERCESNGRTYFTNVDGSMVRVLTRSSATDNRRPVLLINGLGSKLEMWGLFVNTLQDRPLLMFDLPGITGTPAHDLPLTMAGLARWITQLMDAEGVDQVDVIGYSWGGALAQQLARSAPSRVCSLVLSSTNYGFSGMAALPSSPFPYLGPAEGRDNLWDLFSAAIGGTVGERDPIRAIVNVLDPSTTPLEGYWRQVVALTGWTSIPWLHELDVPTLVVAGDEDPYIATSTTRRLAKSIPGARLELIQGGGHLLPISQPARVAILVEDFYKALADDRSRR